MLVHGHCTSECSANVGAWSLNKCATQMVTEQVTTSMSAKGHALVQCRTLHLFSAGLALQTPIGFHKLLHIT